MNPNPGSPLGTPVTLFRIWQFANILALEPETSGDNGTTWSSIGAAGINVSGNSAGNFPAFAVNPKPVFSSGQFQTELLFGTNKVYLTRTTSSVWDPVGPILGTGLLTAVQFGPTSGYYWAGNARRVVVAAEAVFGSNPQP